MYCLCHRIAYCRILYLEVFAQKKLPEIEGLDADFEQQIPDKDGMILRKF